MYALCYLQRSHNNTQLQIHNNLDMSPNHKRNGDKTEKTQINIIKLSATLNKTRRQSIVIGKELLNYKS